MATKPALGILLPVARGSNGYFNQGFDALTQVKSNLINLMLTKKGERIMQPQFGCDIHSLVFDNITNELIAKARSYIEESIRMWMPFIKVQSIDITSSKDYNEVYITLKYSLKTTISIIDTISLVLRV